MQSKQRTRKILGYEASDGATPAWLWGLLLFGALLIGQGALRKWFLPSLATPLYVAKDVTLIATAFLFVRRHVLVKLTRPLKESVFPTLWSAFAFVVFLQAFNLNVPSVAVGILGIRSYLLYSILIVLIPLALQRVRSPERVIALVIVLFVLPVLLLGLYQYWQPVDSWINRYVADEVQVVSVLSHPRITGTFSYIGGMSSFLSFSLFLGLGTLVAGMLYKHRFYQILGGLLLALALVVAPMNGSRSVIFGFLVPLPVILYAVLRRHRGTAVVVSLLLITSTVVFASGEEVWFTEGWKTIGHRVETASDQDTRIQSMFLGPINKVPVGGVLGYGAGSTHQAAAALSDQGRIRIEGVGYEGELGRILIELGIFGSFLHLFIKLWLAWIAWRAMRRASTPWTTLLAITSFGILLLGVGVSMIVFNHIAGSLYWICAGCAVWVWSRQEVETKLSQRAPTHA